MQNINWWHFKLKIYREVRKRKEAENEQLKQQLKQAKKSLEKAKNTYTNLRSQDDQYADMEATTAGSTVSYDMS